MSWTILRRSGFFSLALAVFGCFSENPLWGGVEGAFGVGPFASGQPTPAPLKLSKNSNDPLTRPSGTLSPSGGEGVKSNVYFPLALTGRGDRGEGTSAILSVADFFIRPLPSSEIIFIHPGGAASQHDDSRATKSESQRWSRGYLGELEERTREFQKQMEEWARQFEREFCNPEKQGWLRQFEERSQELRKEMEQKAEELQRRFQSRQWQEQLRQLEDQARKLQKQTEEWANELQRRFQSPEWQKHLRQLEERAREFERRMQERVIQ
ncbi:MAG: hypothetical protein DMG06_11130 [Acidobacteria bacterium]|nr:MAG: hypothetical protein DMG06_11130 [Acidobacteriota bacterium]